MNASTKNEQLAAATVGDPRWAAVVARDHRADGVFYYSVATTGVYCRPSCASRRARPENVRFHASRADAEASGFRPCKRCKPDRPPLLQDWAARVAGACRLIERSDTPLSLGDLARSAGISSYHFHRVFKRVTGLTPRDYATAHRENRVRSELRRGRTVTEAIYDAGYRSNARFYEKADEVLGMAPARYRAGGDQTAIRFAVSPCSLGWVLVARSERGVCAITMGDDPGALARELRRWFPNACLSGGDAAFGKVVAAVVGLVEAPGRDVDLPLDIRGTAFQKRVWQALRRIPAGKTVSYAELARRIGAPGSVRAVARACATNTLSLAIPCHRAVRSDGGLAGYRWGMERKRALIERERRGRRKGDR